MTQAQDEITLLAGIYKQQSEILQRLQSLQGEVATLKGRQTEPGDIWAIGYQKLKAALALQGLEVSIVKLKKLRACNVLRISTELEELEARNIGTESIPRWRFHVGNCHREIARFEQLSVQEQRRILALRRGAHALSPRSLSGFRA